MPIVAGLGHEVIAREFDVHDVGPVTARERPDAAVGRRVNAEPYQLVTAQLLPGVSVMMISAWPD